MIGIGVAANVATVIIGSLLGVAIGDRFRAATRLIVTDAIALATLLIAAQSVIAVNDTALVDATGPNAPVLIVLGSLVIGGIIGSLLRLEERIEAFGGLLQRKLSRSEASQDRQRFIEGFVTSSLVFCVGPLTVLGSLNEGLGRGPDLLLLKAVLDGFASLAFAASFGIGVLASAISVAALQGTLVIVGLALGDVLPDPHIAAMTATGGLLLVAVALRLFDLRRINVADMLPALIIAPLLVQVIVMAR